MNPSSTPEDQLQVVGVDACPGGWVAIILQGGFFAGALLDPDLKELVQRCPEAAIFGIDMPLGLLEVGWRQADVEAAKHLGHVSSSVFRIPPREVWSVNDYPAANARCSELTGAGLSRQAFGLRYKLLAANQLYDEGDARLCEVHPEVSFAAMGKPPACRKKTWRGQAERRQLLVGQGIELPDDFGEAERVNAIPVDDILDAAAAAWSAHRIASGRACSLPTEPQRNERGQALAIWY